MKEFVQFLITEIATEKEAIQITETEENGFTRILVKVSDKDMPLVIGKAGKNIKAIRNLVRAKAIKDGKRISLDLEEPIVLPS